MGLVYPNVTLAAQRPAPPRQGLSFRPHGCSAGNLSALQEGPMGTELHTATHTHTHTHTHTDTRTHTQTHTYIIHTHTSSRCPAGHAGWSKAVLLQRMKLSSEEGQGVIRPTCYVLSPQRVAQVLMCRRMCFPPLT